MILTKTESYIRRCNQLAVSAKGHVAPNPMVGCVIVKNGKVIAEGFHRQFGGDHAEPSAIKTLPDDFNFEECELYVNLEPCSHFGKTPPCADLIIRKKIPAVFIGCRDPFEKVNGQGIENLESAGIKVFRDILKEECLELNKRFFTYHIKKRPYIILKWAETENKLIAGREENEKKISDHPADILVHKWRGEEGGILCGTNTVIQDDPRLDTRHYKGKNPVRLIPDRNGRIPKGHKIYMGDQPTKIFTAIPDHPLHIGINKDADLLEQILEHAYKSEIQSILIEGGSLLINEVIRRGLWDEARIIKTGKFYKEGVPAPQLNKKIISEMKVGNDLIHFYRNI